MYAATPVIIGIMGVTTAVSLYALVQLRRSHPSTSQHLATVVLGLLLFTAALFFLTFGGKSSPMMMAVAMAPQVLSIWVFAATLHLVLYFRIPMGPKYRWTAAALVYSPAAVVTIVLAAAPAVMSGIYVPGEPEDFFHVHYDLIGPFVIGIATVYLVCALVILAMILRSRAAGSRNEMALIFALMALSFLDAPLELWTPTGIPKTAVPILFQSFIGIALAYAVMRECPLIVPKREKEAAEGAETMKFAPGSTHLCLHIDREMAHNAFTSVVKSGVPGLWVTRRIPQRGRAVHGLVNTPFLWLTSANVDGELCINPAETGRLGKTLLEFMATAGECIILFEGLEYITSNIGFKGALNLLQFLNDKVMSSGGVLLVALDARAFKPEELALLRSEATAVHDEGDGECAQEMKRSGAPAGASKPAGTG